MIRKLCSAANQTRIEQGLFRCRIERFRYRDITGGAAHGRGKAKSGQCPKALFSLYERLEVLGIELMPGIAGMIHYDLSCHCQISFKVLQPPELIPANFVPSGKSPVTRRQPYCSTGRACRERRLRFGLSIPSYLKQNPVMENQSDRPVGFQGLVQWATTRPQAYATYFVALILIGGLSFYAGTLKPKKVPTAPPSAVSVPQG